MQLCDCKIMRLYNCAIVKLCSGGGIGRHVGFKILCFYNRRKNRITNFLRHFSDLTFLKLHFNGLNFTTQLIRNNASVVELVDTLDSKFNSILRVRVRVSPEVPFFFRFLFYSKLQILQINVLSSRDGFF